jgi:hypothetical protein
MKSNHLSAEGWVSLLFGVIFRTTGIIYFKFFQPVVAAARDANNYTYKGCLLFLPVASLKGSRS